MEYVDNVWHLIMYIKIRTIVFHVLKILKWKLKTHSGHGWNHIFLSWNPKSQHPMIIWIKNYDNCVTIYAPWWFNSLTLLGQCFDVITYWLCTLPGQKGYRLSEFLTFLSAQRIRILMASLQFNIDESALKLYLYLVVNWVLMWFNPLSP